MPAHNELGLLMLGILLNGALALGVLAVSLYQVLKQRQARYMQTRVETWISSRQRAGKEDKTVWIPPPSYLLEPKGAKDLIRIAQNLWEYPGTKSRRTTTDFQKIHLLEEEYAALTQYLSREILRAELMSGARLRSIVYCIRLLAQVPQPEWLSLLLSALTVRHPVLTGEVLRAIGYGAHSYEAATVPLAATIRHRSDQDGPLVLATHWTLTQILTAHPRNIPLLAKDPVASIRSLAMTVAGTLSPEAGRSLGLVPVLEQGMKDPDSEVRAAAYSSLTQIEPSWTSTLLKIALADASEAPSLAVLNHLSPSDDPGEAFHLIQAWRHASPRLSRHLRRSLATITAPLAADVVKLLLQDPMVCQAMGYLGHQDVAPTLLPLLEDPRPDWRYRAARALAILARTLYPEFLASQVQDDLLDRLAEEQDPLAIAGLAEAVTYAVDDRGKTALLNKIPKTPAALRERLVEAIAIHQRIRSGATVLGDASA